ncbi:MAG: hypothetical protein CVU05_01230 [Bacteroidetes bacterium HGW-Bacteroidetes-21]|jgi:hypothetical protein|nr:MAG: hypothetical protein CVU05_01230 [Bacteroidetes bacterium HGW-Bacteroidetes-21]
MMKNAIIIFSCIAIFSYSCSEKRKQEKLIGSWDVVFLTAAESGSDVTWTFAEGGSLFVTSRGTDTTIVDSASYFMDSKFLDAYYVTISDLNYWEDGKYMIQKMNRKILIMERVMMPDGQTSGSYLHKEFVKKEQ